MSVTDQGFTTNVHPLLAKRVLTPLLGAVHLAPAVKGGADLEFAPFPGSEPNPKVCVVILSFSRRRAERAAENSRRGPITQVFVQIVAMISERAQNRLRLA